MYSIFVELESNTPFKPLFMHFTATATNGTKKVKENLDNTHELNEFCDKMERRGFLSVVLEVYNNFGLARTLSYSYTGEIWELQK